MSEIKTSNDLLRLMEAVHKIETLPEESIAEIAQYLLTEVQATARQGVDPYDLHPWISKKDGSRALPDVAKDISVRSWRRKVEMKLTGGGAYHNKGSTHHGIKRQIIPDRARGLPARLAPGIIDILQRNFHKTMGAK
ncbi:MAG: hypothetical protein ACOYBP_08910 [Microbacteriaceae bacterium]